jgi:hypothetical protein
MMRMGLSAFGLAMALWSVTSAFVGCVNTSKTNDSGTGGRAGTISTAGNSGVAASVSSSVSTGGRPALPIDTATDGQAGTGTTGPYVWKSVTIRGGGFVDGIIFSQLEPDLIYARTDMGGAYRWDVAMNGWVPLTDWVSQSNSNYWGIESLAIDPIDPDIVYMAAGAYLTSGNGVILRSTDRGATWTVNSIGVPMGGNSTGRSMGERLAIDPNLASTLYFGARRNGLYKSTDSGATWATVASFPVTGATDLGLSFVLFDPRSGTAGNGSSVIYVGVADVAANSNLYVSKDSGNSWELVAGGPSAFMPHHGVIDANGMLYLAYNQGTQTTSGTTVTTDPATSAGPNGVLSGAIWRYDTASGNWTDISPPKGACGFGGISLDAANTGTIAVSTIDCYALGDEIYRTTDGGAHWTGVGLGAQRNRNGAEYLCFGPPGCNRVKTPNWAGDIEVDPFNPDRVMHVSGQGVWSTENFTASSASDVLWTFSDRNLEQTAVTDLVPSVNGVFLSCVGDIAGTRSTDGLDHPSPNGMYNNPVFGTCNSLDFAANNPQIVARGGNASSSNSGQIGAYSKDNGLTWAPFPTVPTGATTTGAGGTVAVSADGSIIMWTPPGVTAPAYTTDFGTTWTSSTGLSGARPVFADRANPNKFYAYSGGTIYVSSDGGKTFAAAAGGLAASTGGGRGGGPRVRAVFGREGDIWIALGATSSSAGTLFHSTDSGATVAAVANVTAPLAVGFGKPAVDGQYPAVYLIGTVSGTYGIFRSDDQGASWTRINDNQHQFGPAGYVAGDEQVYGRVYVGTNGRGILYGDPAPASGNSDAGAN